MAEPNLYEPKIGKGYHTGKNMAANLAICPVPKGVEAYEVAVFGLAKGLLHHIPIQARLDDVIG